MKKLVIFFVVTIFLFACKKEDPFSENGYRVEINNSGVASSTELAHLNLIDKNNLFNIYTLGINNTDNTPNSFTQLIIEDRQNAKIIIYKINAQNNLCFYATDYNGVVENLICITKINTHSFQMKIYFIDTKNNAILNKNILIDKANNKFQYTENNDSVRVSSLKTEANPTNSKFTEIIKAGFSEDIVVEAVAWLVKDNLHTKIFDNPDLELLFENINKANQILKAEVNEVSLSKSTDGKLQNVEDIRKLLNVKLLALDFNSLFFQYKILFDGYEYTAIDINGKLWFTENLRTSITAKDEPLMAYSYDGYLENSKVYGKLYKYKDAIRACPTGWRLPTKQEWRELVTFFGNNETAYLKLIQDGESKMELMFAGYMSSDNTYTRLNNMGAYWTITKQQENRVISYFIIKNSTTITETDSDVNYAFSVRCVK